jgi:hypothetical protein
VDVDLRLLLPLLGVLALTLLLTGPGMWSESWGWWWVRRKKGAPPPGDGERRAP